MGEAKASKLEEVDSKMAEEALEVVSRNLVVEACSRKVVAEACSKMVAAEVSTMEAEVEYSM